jgi:putative membrane-bound dehydrogenase-like protein
MPKRLVSYLTIPAMLLLGASLNADEFPSPVNTQAPGEHPPSPHEMLDLFELPPGFRVSLFAGEPDVQQPIAFDFDDRGRVWVAENYTYSAHGQIDANLRDRIIILHDQDGDGQHDERKVFWDKGSMLTSLTWGFGGLWVLNDGTLAFIPDRNGDDIPDSEPVVMLDGWTKQAGHNFVSGLMWGPDGWLYGRHGITESSLPGTPDTPEAERQPMNCGIWRFHPTRHKFEVVCNGTTNPWGLDYNTAGQMFFTNNVIGHLWHVIPGAHYQRMFGQDFNPHLYELMEQTADHYHWDTTGQWNESRDGKADHLGGGHSHCGGMIYQGDNFPEQYRGKMFMCNTHGRCVNVDRLERSASGYVAKHDPNFLKVNTPWFRGVELKYGPAGCVYLSDWSDNGECHDHDGVHRTSGRIYRISYGGPVRNVIDPDVQLTEQQNWKGSTEWRQRKVRRLLQEQASADPDGAGVRLAEFYAASLTDDSSAQHKLNALWGLATVDGLTREIIEPLLHEDDEALVSAAVRLGVEAGYFAAPPPEPRVSFSQSSAGDAAPLIKLTDSDSGLIILTLASSLQRMDNRTRIMVARRLVDRVAEWNDDNLTRLVWYGLVDETSPAALLYVVSGRQTPTKLLQFVARRVVQMQDQSGVVMSQLLSASGPAGSPDAQKAVLQGMLEGLRGQHKPQAPDSWAKDQLRFADSTDADVARLARELSVLFGDGAALMDLRTLVADRNGDHAARSQAIVALAQAEDSESIPLLLGLLNDRAVYVTVAGALAAFDDPRIPQELLSRWGGLRHGSREAAVDTLVSRQSYAEQLVAALERGQVSPDDLTASHVRQVLAFGDQRLSSVIEAKWGVINDSSEARTAAIASAKERLTADVLATADLTSGAALFKKTCANCHRLYGEGGRIGPDLTGGNRGNLDYLLGNVIDPSAEVPRQFTTSIIALTSGRVITGVVVAETDSTISIQTDKELMVIAINDIEERVRTKKSLMPDGLLDSLSEDQVRNLIAFVMQRR